MRAFSINSGRMALVMSLALCASQSLQAKKTKSPYMAGEATFVNCIAIEAPEGLIVYDTGDYAEESKHFRDVIESQNGKLN